MSNVTALVDTLLAARLGQRVDGPGAVANVGQIDNDVRLPSREALQRELGVGPARPGNRPLPTAAFAPAGAGGAVILSAAARTVSALLNLSADTPPPVRGRSPLAPDVHAAVSAPVLSAVLARTVAASGLFYESHLQQYAGGLRTLAQLAQEPQAGLPSPLPLSGRSALPAAAVAPDAGPAAGSTDFATAVLQADTDGPPAPLPSAPVPSRAQTLQAAHAAQAAQTSAPGGAAVHPAVTHELPALATVYGPTGLPDTPHAAAHEFALADAAGEDARSPEAGPAADSAASRPMAGATHPDALGLVRQQLEMLAVPVFRWSGEAWPNVPMEWEIRQEDAEPQSSAGKDEADPAPGAWSTRMTLRLPRLGDVDVRLGLVGMDLQLRMDAVQEATASELNEAAPGLAARLRSQGLALTDLRIAGVQAGQAAAGQAGGGDAHP